MIHTKSRHALAAPIPHTLDELARIAQEFWTANYERKHVVIECGKLPDGALGIVGKCSMVNQRPVELTSQMKRITLDEFRANPQALVFMLAEINEELRARISFKHKCPTIAHVFAAQGWHDG